VGKSYRRSGWPDAIKHVCAQCNRHNKVLRVSNAHDISRLVLGQEPGTGVHPRNVSTIAGSWCTAVTYTLQNASFASPPDKPPIAIPGVSLATISSVHLFRRSKSKPPWMIQKRFCRSGYLCAAMQRSSHRTDRSMASVIRARSGDVVAITSSNCIIMSEPMEFCSEIECSGVRSLGTRALDRHINRRIGDPITSATHRVGLGNAHLLP
jgi:hypothetical protein